MFAKLKSLFNNVPEVFTETEAKYNTKMEAISNEIANAKTKLSDAGLLAEDKVVSFETTLANIEALLIEDKASCEANATVS